MINVFIVDDTVYTRGRSKKVELLSWVREHSKKISVRGFRLLTLGWSDGNSFFPVNDCLLASAKKDVTVCTDMYRYAKTVVTSFEEIQSYPVIRR